MLLVKFLWATYHMFRQSTDYFYQNHYTVTDVNYFNCSVVAYQNIINVRSSILLHSKSQWRTLMICLCLIKESFILKKLFFSFRCSFCMNWLKSQVKFGIKFRGREFYISLLSILKPWQDLLLLALQLKAVLGPLHQIPAHTAHLLTLGPLRR